MTFSLDCEGTGALRVVSVGLLTNDPYVALREARNFKENGFYGNALSRVTICYLNDGDPPVELEFSNSADWRPPDWFYKLGR